MAEVCGSMSEIKRTGKPGFEKFLMTRKLLKMMTRKKILSLNDFKVGDK